MNQKQHPFKQFKDKEYRNDRSKRIQLCVEFIEKGLCDPGCRKLRSRTGEDPFYKCHCLQVLQDKDDENDMKNARVTVATHMVAHYDKTPAERTDQLMDWIKYAMQDGSLYKKSEDNKPRFFIPLGESDETIDITNYPTTSLICKGALGHLFDFKATKWAKMKKAIISNRIPSHGNKGRTNRATGFNKTGCRDAILEFLDNVAEMEGAPQSTRMVREATGSGLRYGEEGVVELPPSLTKRLLYRRFCEERGWDTSTSDRGLIRCVPREGEQQQEVGSWTTFRNLWKKEFPNLKTRKSAEDVCTLCYTYSNAFRRQMRRSAPDFDLDICEIVTEDGDAAAPSDSDEEESEDDEPIIPVALTLEPSEKQKERDALLEAAALHVKQASAMRDKANEKILLAQHDAIEETPHDERVYTLVMDYAQNCELPHLGSNQPGKTYYYSPLKINVFGIVNAGKNSGYLDAYLYHEGEGRKGGNNVASLLIKYLVQRKWLREDSVGKELNLICDNCGGQNKNNMVIRLAPLLVELGYFKRVNFIFYVVGHTKNVADRLFNSLKRRYRRENVWTMRGLLKVFNNTDTGTRNNDLLVHKAHPKIFRNYGKLLSELYRMFDPGWCRKGHIFSADISYMQGDSKFMMIYTDSIATHAPHKQDLNLDMKSVKEKKVLKRKRTPKDDDLDAAVDRKNEGILQSNEQRAKLRKQRWSDLATLGIIDAVDPIQPLDITNIKKIELGTKYRPLVPPQFRTDSIYTVPTKESLDLEKKRKRVKKEQKEEWKRGLLQHQEGIDGTPIEARDDEMAAFPFPTATV